MLTVSFWPILCALDMAWRSFWGFQSLSKMTTVSAVARLMPSPPARVDNRKAKSPEPGALKCSIACTRAAVGATGKHAEFQLKGHFIEITGACGIEVLNCLHTIACSAH